MQINSLSEQNILARAVVPECCRALILLSQLYLKRVGTSFLDAFWLVSNIIYGSCFFSEPREPSNYYTPYYASLRKA